MPMECRCSYKDGVVDGLCGAHQIAFDKLRTQWKDRFKSQLEVLDTMAMGYLRNGKSNRATGIAEAVTYLRERNGIVV